MVAEESFGQVVGQVGHGVRLLGPAGAAPVSVLPARGVPVAAQVGCLERHHDHVPESLRDVLVATRAQVCLHRLERVNPADLYLGISAHSTRASVMATAAATST
jgi:hypothetical protein